MITQIQSRRDAIENGERLLAQSKININQCIEVENNYTQSIIRAKQELVLLLDQELDKAIDALQSVKEKIRLQGAITNERDERHRDNLVELINELKEEIRTL